MKLSPVFLGLLVVGLVTVCVVTLYGIGYGEYDPLSTVRNVFQLSSLNSQASVGGNRVLPIDPTSCSFDIFRQDMLQHDFFPSQGKWNQENRTLKFVPDDCKFDGPSVSPAYLKQCLVRNKLKKVLLVGDSNGKRVFNNLLSVLNASGLLCQKLKGERGGQFNTDAEYFTDGTSIKPSDVRTQKRGCRTCRSELHLCVEQNNTISRKPPLVVALEFVLMEYYLDTEIITAQSKSYQEFIFMEYLKRNYPDLVIIFANSHSIRKKQFLQIKASMEMLAGIVQNTVPKTNPVVWVSGPGEYDKKKPKKWQNHRFGPNKNTSQEMIQIVNNALFQTLKPSLIDKNSNSFGFFDLQSMSNDMLAEWSKDGIHMQEVWYQHVVSYLIQSICNSQAIEKLRNQSNLVKLGY